MLELRLLGAPQVSLDGLPLADGLINKDLALLFYLATTGQPQAWTSLAVLLWGDLSHAASLSNLRKSLSALHAKLGDHIDIEREQVGLIRSCCTVDLLAVRTMGERGVGVRRSCPVAGGDRSLLGRLSCRLCRTQRAGLRRVAIHQPGTAAQYRRPGHGQPRHRACRRRRPEPGHRLAAADPRLGTVARGNTSHPDAVAGTERRTQCRAGPVQSMRRQHGGGTGCRTRNRDNGTSRPPTRPECRIYVPRTCARRCRLAHCRRLFRRRFSSTATCRLSRHRLSAANKNWRS